MIKINKSKKKSFQNRKLITRWMTRTLMMVLLLSFISASIFYLCLSVCYLSFLHLFFYLCLSVSNLLFLHLFFFFVCLFVIFHFCIYFLSLFVCLLSFISASIFYLCLSVCYLSFLHLFFILASQLAWLDDREVKITWHVYNNFLVW